MYEPFCTLFSGLFEMVCAFSLAAAGVVASRNIHSDLLCHIIRCPMAFFETTPRGRIMNRFSQDLSDVDFVMPFTVRSVINVFYGTVAHLGVIAYATPYFLVSLPVFAVIYLVIQVTHSQISCMYLVA
jgi:ABC-type multidrug transport system fused ATPase/permease subunit